MSSVKTRSKAVADRIALVKSDWPLPKEHRDTMTEMKAVLHEATEKVATIIEGVEHDEDALKDFTKTMCAAKDIACHAIILPTNPK